MFALFEVGRAAPFVRERSSVANIVSFRAGQSQAATSQGTNVLAQTVSFSGAAFVPQSVSGSEIDYQITGRGGRIILF